MCSSSFNISNQIFVRKWEQRQFRQSREYFFLSALLPPKHLCTQKTGQETNLFNKPNRSSVYLIHLRYNYLYIYVYKRLYIYIVSLALGTVLSCLLGKIFCTGGWGWNTAGYFVLCTIFCAHYRLLCTLVGTLRCITCRYMCNLALNDIISSFEDSDS